MKAMKLNYDVKKEDVNGVWARMQDGSHYGDIINEFIMAESQIAAVELGGRDATKTRASLWQQIKRMGLENTVITCVRGNMLYLLRRENLNGRAK